MRNGKQLYTPNEEDDWQYIEGLTNDQETQFNAMRDFLYRQGDEMYCLKGYAGTGKTFLISRVMQYVEVNKHHFGKKSLAVMTAPTNKAVQVLRDSSPLDIRKMADFKTVHQLLGLKEHINENGSIEYKPSFDEAPTFDSYVICVIDEVSMLSDELFYLIKNNAANVKIIMMGDPLQVPAIGKADCEPFLNPETHNITTGLLSTIMRQKQGSSLVELSMHIRGNVQSDILLGSETKEDLTVISSQTEKQKAVAIINDWFKPDTDISMNKVVAWTNAKVKEYNKYIRQVHYGNQSKQMLINGERMIANEPVLKKVKDKFGVTERILLFTSQEFNVLEFHIDKVDYTTHENKVVPIQVYTVKIEYYDFDTMKNEISYINIVHEDGQHIYQKTLEKIKQSAIHAIPSKRKWFWKEFYKFKRGFADVSYAYAITIHKAQGSTYNKVVVDANNIFLNNNIVERNRILYTAITRAKHHALIIN
jgi:exodeoxyribonuclease-5